MVKVKAGDEFVSQLPTDCGRLIDSPRAAGGHRRRVCLKDSVAIVERDDARALARSLLKW